MDFIYLIIIIIIIIIGKITLHVAQIVNTEQLQHIIPKKRVFFFQVYNCKYPE